MARLLAETGDRLIQETGFVVLLEGALEESVSSDVPFGTWAAITPAGTEVWATVAPTPSNIWTRTSPASVVWVDIETL